MTDMTDMTDITHIARPPGHPGDGTGHLRRPVSILGAGHIGFAIALLLQQTGDYDILVADPDPMRLATVSALGIATRQTAAGADWSSVIDGRFAVLDALPFHCAVALATACAQAGVHYFDLREDVRRPQ